MEIVDIEIKRLYANKGQLEGVPRNPRKWEKDELKNLAVSLKETPELFQMRPCIVAQYNDGFVVLGGNMRLAAATMNHDDTCPCIVVPNDMSAEKMCEIVAKDNGAFGEWDVEALTKDWNDKPLKDWGVKGVWEEISDCTSSDVSSNDAVEDDFSENEEIEQRVSSGDIWQLGEHRLMCGDSALSEDVKTLMGGDLADMVFTDPPYGVSIGDKNQELNNVQKAGRCCKNIENDTLSPAKLYPILVNAMTNARVNCKEDASYYVTSPQGGELGMMMMMMKDAGLPVRHILIWEKNSATFSLGRLDYDYQHEPIFYTWTKKHHNYRGGEFRTTIWKYDKPRKCDLHPTMKPVPLVCNCLLDATKEGDIVLDVFGGSGTTLIACEQLGRKARLMELDPHYCDVIIARWEKLTGLTAKKIMPMVEE